MPYLINLRSYRLICRRDLTSSPKKQNSVVLDRASRITYADAQVSVALLTGIMAVLLCQ